MIGPDELTARHYDAVYNLAYRAMGRRQDAEDVTQQTFARALARLADLRDPEAARAWLLRIATNVGLDELRRRGRDVSCEEAPEFWSNVTDPDPLVTPTRAVELRELRVDVWQ